MGLNKTQKEFIRENHARWSSKKLARKLGVEHEEVKRAIKKLGKEDQPAEPGRLGSLLGHLKKLGILERYWLSMGLVVGLAFLLRLVHLIEVSDTPFFLHLHTDPAMYNRWALEITSGDWLGGKRPVFYLGPLFPYFLAVVYSLFGESTFAAGVVQALLSAASAGLICHLGRRLFGWVPGLLAGLMAAVYAMFIFYSSLMLGATLIIFLNLLMLVMLVSGMQKPAWWKWVLAGIFFGLSAAARGNVLLFGPLAVLAIGLACGLKNWKKWLPAGGLLTAAFFLTILPVSYHNWWIGRDFALLTTNAGANFYIGNHPDSEGLYRNSPKYQGRPLGLSVRDQQANCPAIAKQELGVEKLRPSEVSSFWVSKTFEVIGEDPGRWLGLLAKKLRYFASAYEVPNNRNFYFSKRFSWTLHLPLLTFGVIFPLSVLGMLVFRRSFRTHGVLTLFAGAHLAALTLFFITGRYRLVVVPVLLIYAAAFVVWLGKKLRDRELEWKTGAWVGGLLLLGYLAAYYPVTRFSYRANFTNLANAYRKMDQPEQALANYDRAISLARGYFYAHLKKGELLAELGRSEEARESLQTALSLAQRNQDQVNVRRIQSQLDKLGE